MKKKKRVSRRNFEEWFFAAVFFFVLLLILAGLDRVNYEQWLLEKEKGKLLNSVATDTLVGGNLAFVIHNKIDKGRLQDFAKRNYYELKAELGLSKDFVILFTNDDETVVPIGNLTCIGSPNSKVAGISCG
jgi:hypothetical protein